MTVPKPDHRLPAGRTRSTGNPRRGRWRSLRWGLSVGFPSLLLAVLSRGEEAPTPAPTPVPRTPAQDPANSPGAAPEQVGNQLKNPGFEEQTQRWGWMQSIRWIGFGVVAEPVHSGLYAAQMSLRWQPGDREKPISTSGAVQDLALSRFPDRISGWYWVERWENPSDQTLLYLDVAVAVVGDPRAHDIIIPDDPELHPDLANYQIRYYMAGLTEPYENLLNMRAKMVGVGPPELGKWVHFDFPVKADFQQLWGAVPADFDYVRIFFEARWEEKEEGAPVHAEFYYDDLFFGFDEPLEP